jgi:hypothetical protein
MRCLVKIVGAKPVMLDAVYLALAALPKVLV